MEKEVLRLEGDGSEDEEGEKERRREGERRMERTKRATERRIWAR